MTDHQPREHPVPCRYCHHDTWSWDAVCPRCVYDEAQAALDVQTTETAAAR